MGCCGSGRGLGQRSLAGPHSIVGPIKLEHRAIYACHQIESCLLGLNSSVLLHFYIKLSMQSQTSLLAVENLLCVLGCLSLLALGSEHPLESVIYITIVIEVIKC